MLKYLVFGLVTICVRSTDAAYCQVPYECDSTCYRTTPYKGSTYAGYCQVPYECDSTCYRSAPYKGWCVTGPCYKSRPTDAAYCQVPYECDSTCYRTTTYKGWCLLGPCYKSRLEPYTCKVTCYKRECCQGYTGIFCLTPLCYGSKTCPKGGKCIKPDECNCLPGYYGKRCKACGPLPHVTNGQFKVNANIDITAKLECAAGYIQQPNQSPPFEITCDKNGEWTPKDITVTCEVLDCGHPTQKVDNGQFVIIHGTKFGNLALLRCDSEFTVTGGDEFIECGTDGQWTTTQATCVPGGKCDRNYIHYNDKCYRAFTRARSWDDALSDCQGEGGTLASPLTQEQFDFIAFALRKGASFVTRYWVGLRNVALDNNVYTWTVDGSALSGYDPWFPGEPNGLNEGCAELKFLQDVYHLNDKVCSQRQYYVCEKNAT